MPNLRESPSAQRLLRSCSLDDQIPGLKRESPIERRILNYLARHPRAQDTFRGIVEWWLLKQRISETTAEVEGALARLVAKGKVCALHGPDGQVHYRLRKKLRRPQAPRHLVKRKAKRQKAL